MNKRKKTKENRNKTKGIFVFPESMNKRRKQKRIEIKRKGKRTGKHLVRFEFFFFFSWGGGVVLIKIIKQWGPISFGTKPSNIITNSKHKNEINLVLSVHSFYIIPFFLIKRQSNTLKQSEFEHPNSSVCT